EQLLGASGYLGIARHSGQRGRFGRNDLNRIEPRAHEGGARRHRSPGSLQDRLQDRRGLWRQLVERPVAVLAGAEVDLGGHVGAELRGDVDEQGDVDAIALDERELLEQLAPAGVLAAQGLHDRRQLREQQRQRGTGDELGDTSAPVAGIARRPVVEALHEVDVRMREQRAQEAEYEVRLEVDEVGIAPHDEVTLALVERAPERSALAVTVAEIGHYPGRRAHTVTVHADTASEDDGEAVQRTADTVR